jgi:two-component system, NarL family, response regulator DevR
MTSIEPQTIRVLVVDDHRVVRVGVRALLEEAKHLHIVGEAATMKTAIAECLGLRPNVVVMDVKLPDGTGIEACREIMRTQPLCRILFHSASGDESVLFDAIRAGASGFLLKESQDGSLQQAIEQVAGGQWVIDPIMTSCLASHIHKPRESEDPDLSRQESRILDLVAQGQTNKEIGVSLNLSGKTVRNYLSRIFEKLGVSRRAHAAARRHSTTGARDAEASGRYQSTGLEASA